MHMHAHTFYLHTHSQAAHTVHEYSYCFTCMCDMHTHTHTHTYIYTDMHTHTQSSRGQGLPLSICEDQPPQCQMYGGHTQLLYYTRQRRCDMRLNLTMNSVQSKLTTLSLKLHCKLTSSSDTAGRLSS